MTEPLLQRALAISEKALGPDHPETAISLHRLVELYRGQGHYDKAELLSVGSGFLDATRRVSQRAIPF